MLSNIFFNDNGNTQLTFFTMFGAIRAGGTTVGTHTVSHTVHRSSGGLFKSIKNFFKQTVGECKYDHI